MPLTIYQFPCLADNYAFLVRDEGSGEVACIDTPDADAILRELQRFGGRLDLIMNTHWHADHAGGNAALQAATGARIIAPAEVARVSAVDVEVAGGERVMLGETVFEVLASGGHTLGHVAYYAQEAGVAFVGDTLFALGCGRMFEGTPQQMWASLQRIAALPDDTRIYCAHEYTAANARFALSVDTNSELLQRAESVARARSEGIPTVPTTVGAEKATNPFLRAPQLAAALGMAGAADHEVFAALRAAKDAFKG